MAEIEEILENHEKRINALEIAESVKKGTEVDLIEKWLEWNEKKITSHDFCMAFESVFRKEIRERIKYHRSLKKRILREMVRDE